MTFVQWTSMLACAGELTCAALALWRSGGSPLSLRLALLSFNLFAWNFAELAYSLSAQPAWQLIDVAVSPWSPPLALAFTATFVGKRRPLRHALRASFIAFGGLSAVALLAFVFPWARQVIEGSGWSTWFLIGLVPTMLTVLALLLVHLRAAASEAERTRTRLILLALVLGTVFGATDLLAGQGFQIPRLANLGVLTGNVLLLVVTVRFRLLESSLTSAHALASALLAAVSVVTYVQLLRSFAPYVALPILASATLGAVLFALIVPLSLRARRRTLGLRRLAALGRVSDQLAHDLQNPLAAMRGAAQFLREELARGKSLDGRLEFFDLLVEQVDRMTATIERYRRLGRVEPQRTVFDLNQLVERVLALQPLARSDVAVRLTLAPGPLTVSADADLLSTALHNLARNGLEAMPSGGTLTVETIRAQGPRESGIRLSVEDTGTGMDARVREQAFDDFFTTKAHGTGLGLAFVRRVIEAHGGDVHIRSAEGRGTRVQMFLPETP